MEQDTDLNHVVARASDGSTATFHEPHHFTMNANGDVSTHFDQLGASLLNPCPKIPRLRTPA